MTDSRRGFTLIELMIGLVMVLVVSGVTYRLLITSQRVSRGQVVQSTMQANVRGGALVLLNELRELGYDSITTNDPGLVTDFRSDLLAINNDTIRYRAMRGFGVTCQLANTEIRVRLPLYSYRTPQATDELIIFVEREKNYAIDDEWIGIAVTAVNTGSSCPDGSAAIALTTDMLSGTSLGTGWSTNIVVGGPVRFAETMEMGLYESDGEYWLGAKSVSGGVTNYQPVLGPLQSDGLALRYLDRNGNATGIIRDVRTIEVTIRGTGGESATLSGGALAEPELDLVTEIALRNAMRP